MTRALRLAALLIAIAAVVDPAFAVRRPAPVPIDIELPPADDPDFARATDIQRAILGALGDAVTSDGAEQPAAIVAIGHASLPRTPTAPVFGVTLAAVAPRLRIVNAAPRHAFDGQHPSIDVALDGNDLAGKTTTVTVGASGIAVGRATYAWKADRETATLSVPFTPDSGVRVARVTATAPGVEAAVADVVTGVEARRPRVFVYEPRPSWAAGFARQALESHVLFDVRALARTSRGIDTRSGNAPPTLAALDPEAFDVLVIGGLEGLADADVAPLQRFAAERLGTVVLVPDAALPERVRAAFDLPAMKETLVEKAVELTFGAVALRASELLDPSSAIVRRGNTMVVTALDAWRYRDDRFDAFWRAVVADAAAAATPRMQLRIEPALARPGEAVTVRVNFRVPAGAARLPTTSASLVRADGSEAPVRLWPGTAAGELLGTVTAPGEGQYDVRVNAEGDLQDRVLLVSADATRPVPDRSAAIARAAQMSGGAVVKAGEISTLVERLGALPRATAARRARPMRWPGWAVAFAILLSAEWAIRRRRGLR